MTAMLHGSERVSTGIPGLDGILGSLFWGDNVVWELDHTDHEPFYAAIAGQPHAFEESIVVSVGALAGGISAMAATTRLEAGPATAFPQPADLLREIERRCHVPQRRLLMFDSLDTMAAVWSAQQTRGFLARCCPLLLEAGAIAYWAMSAHEAPELVRDTVRAVTQIILRVAQRSVRVSKAEARGHEVAGSVLHWNAPEGPSSLETPSITGRVAASLRYLRRAHGLTQHSLARLAGVTSSAISQAERGERGCRSRPWSASAPRWGITVDELLRGEDPALYRFGRRVEEPQH